MTDNANRETNTSVRRRKETEPHFSASGLHEDDEDAHAAAEPMNSPTGTMGLP